MDEVVPGIAHWQARHPKLGFDVSSYVIRESAAVLDPMLPEGAGPEWLGGGIERAILTVRHHVRSTPLLGLPVLVHRAGLPELHDEDVEALGFEAGDELAPGIRALAFGRICADDAALHVAVGPGALVFGDGIVNYGGISHPPDEFLGDDAAAVKRDIVDGLAPLLDEDFDVLLFAHGPPIARGGKAALREFVERSR